MSIKTFKLRIYTKHYNQLNELASSVNIVWNYVNDLSFKYLKRHGTFLSSYDLNEYTKGAGEYLNLHSQTVKTSIVTHDVECYFGSFFAP